MRSVLFATLSLSTLLAGPAPAQPRPAAPPPPAPAPAAAPAPAPPTADVDALRREVDELRDELFRSRARAAAVASALYSSKLRVVLSHATGRQQTVTRATVRLDGASVFDDESGAISKGPAARFDGFVAPGRHSITIRIEATGKDDERFTTATESTFALQVPAGKDVTVTAVARDDGDLAYAWKRQESGRYDLRLEVAVATTARAPATAQSPRGEDARRRAGR